MIFVFLNFPTFFQFRCPHSVLVKKDCLDLLSPSAFRHFTPIVQQLTEFCQNTCLSLLLSLPSLLLLLLFPFVFVLFDKRVHKMATGPSSSPPVDSSSESFFSWFLSELLSPVNAILTLICGYLAYRILRGNQEEGEWRKGMQLVCAFVHLFENSFSQTDSGVSSAPILPPALPKHDMTLEELRIYDGTGPDGRVCIAVNRKVFDVTKGNIF